MTTEATPHPWREVRKVLLAARIDPKHVRERGATEQGYWNRDGAWTEWPSPEVGRRVLDARALDLERQGDPEARRRQARDAAMARLLAGDER